MARMNDFDPSRRRLLRLSTSGLLLIPVVNLLGCSDEPAPRSSAPAPSPSTADPSTSDAPQPAAQAPQPASQPAVTAPAGLTRLDETDGAAATLGYKHSADDVDLARFARYEPGQLCVNCSLYQPDASPDPEWGACSIFPGKLVNANGWCNVYQPAG